MALSILVTMLAASAADRWWKALIFGIAAALAARIGFLWYLELAGAHQAKMAVVDALAETAITAAVISPIAYIFAQGRKLARHDKQQAEPRPKPGPWRTPREAVPLISKRLGWPAWIGIGIGLLALIGLWTFAPGSRDRWVRNDGAIACQGPAEIEDIQSMQSVSSRRYMIEDLVAEKKCVPLFGDDRVRIREIGDDGSKVRVVLGTSGHSMWMQLADLKSNSPTLLTSPWRWKEEPPTATGLNKKAQNPFDKFHAAEETPSKLLEERRASVDESVHFVLLTLPRGVELQVPKSWWLLGSDFKNLIAMSAEAVEDLSGLPLRDEKK